MPRFNTLDDLPLAGKTVLLRVDYNVPIKDGRITDLTRLERTLPTLLDLIKAGAKIVILSHFGRPKGKRQDSMSLRPVAQALSTLIKRPVAFAEDCKGEDVKKAVAALSSGEILMLENVRFYEGEEKGDPAFAQELAALGDVFVNDAFGAAHRAHASTTLLARLLPSAAGRLMQSELTALKDALDDPQHPVAALVGGSKISTKLDLLFNLVSKVDVLVLGGGMANTFLAAQGIALGRSLYEADMLEQAAKITQRAADAGCTILLPADVVVTTEIKEGEGSQTVNIDQIPQNKMVVDLGSQAIKTINETLARCKTVLWNGPLGVFEVKPFDHATNEVGRHIAALTKSGQLLSVAGGGDTIAAITHADLGDGISYISTAGGAFLEYLEGKTLPGVEALEKAATL
ncbi:MAG: phosphoglycerate kinase [Alphaproteobacteria bacterium]|nr:phosphoglycerate kinase [Alphaproteobacteria bacterium]